MPKLNDESVILIEEVVDFGLVIVKANFLDLKIRNLLAATIEMEVPKTGKISTGKKLSVGWMSTDEYVIILKKKEADKITRKINVKMKKYHHLCVNMSDSRRCYRLRGKGWREVLSKGSPTNFHPSVFGPGSFRRTRIASVATAIWAADENEAYVISMRSVSEFMFEWLRSANLKSGQITYY